MRMQPQHYLAYAPGNQEFLPGTHHTDGNIRLPANQILYPVCERKLNSEIGMSITQACDDGGEHFNAYHVARGDLDVAAITPLPWPAAARCNAATVLCNDSAYMRSDWPASASAETCL